MEIKALGSLLTYSRFEVLHKLLLANLAHSFRGSLDVRMFILSLFSLKESVQITIDLTEGARDGP